MSIKINKFLYSLGVLLSLVSMQAMAYSYEAYSQQYSKNLEKWEQEYNLKQKYPLLYNKHTLKNKSLGEYKYNLPPSLNNRNKTYPTNKDKNSLIFMGI